MHGQGVCANDVSGLVNRSADSGHAAARDGAAPTMANRSGIVLCLL